jgi:hypothetical protein
MPAQDVDGTELVNAPVYQRLRRRLIGWRARMGHRASTFGADGRGGGAGSVAVAAVDHHACAMLCQQHCDGRADAA